MDGETRDVIVGASFVIFGMVAFLEGRLVRIRDLDVVV